MSNNAKQHFPFSLKRKHPFELPMEGRIPFHFGLFVFRYQHRFEDEPVSLMCSLYQLARVAGHHSYTADPANAMLGLLFIGLVLSSSVSSLPPPLLFHFQG